MSDHGPIQPEFREQMNAMARAIDRFFNGDVAREEKTVGFALLIYKFGDVKGGRVNYIGNGERADMLVALKELVARFEGRVQETETKQ